MPTRKNDDAGPSALLLVPMALLVVAAAVFVGSFRGANGFLATCAIGSILGGMLLTKGK